MSVKITDVAVAIFTRPDGSFLLSSRPEGKPYPGYWEFPGGKLEADESVRDALVRELIEELNVTITHATPWFTFVMHYTHATVRLHCWRVHAWHGEMHGREGQGFAWQRIDALTVSPTLPGCVPIFKALSLPQHYAISNVAELGVASYLQRLEQQLQQGLRLVQVREKQMSSAELAPFACEVVALGHAFGARVLVNSDADLAARVAADGVHLSSMQLAQCRVRPDFELVAASTHNREEIERAGELKLDFVVLGTVKTTLTHPGQAPLGWDIFRAMVEAAPLPVFAIGGLSAGDLTDAIEHGAHGIAMQRGMV